MLITGEGGRGGETAQLVPIVKSFNLDLDS